MQMSCFKKSRNIKLRQTKKNIKKKRKRNDYGEVDEERERERESVIE